MFGRIKIFFPLDLFYFIYLFLLYSYLFFYDKIEAEKRKYEQNSRYSSKLPQNPEFFTVLYFNITPTNFIFSTSLCPE